jgi:hypothetical protein
MSVCRSAIPDAIVDTDGNHEAQEAPADLTARLNSAQYVVLSVDSMCSHRLAFALGCLSVLNIRYVIGYVRFTETDLPPKTPFGVDCIGSVVTKTERLRSTLQEVHSSFG